MTLAFDTSVIIDIQKKNEKTIKKIEELSLRHQEPTPMLFMVYTEFKRGLYKRSKKLQEEIEIWFEELPFLAPTKRTAEIIVGLREKYDKKGEPIPLADLIIASQIKEKELILVTKDKIFNKIEEIQKIII